jgi:DNA polymerase-3 subunit gamma/tau
VSHTALARKYRPRRFAEVATQEHVSETLRRAVRSGRAGHAYLFCGPRGVGKTTLARVLAMALNCPARDSEGEPCGTCESCSLIWSGRTSLDVVEIDAASNRGVDDARSLRERAMYAPSDEHRFKVYIVDEAHMLTREAWNALLKILEEPPPRVMFIFATTEPQRIQQSASPILSRCQRFDFRRVGVADIVARLDQVIDGEQARASTEALRIIARKADGGMRDALSLLDQVLALTGGAVKARSVREVLGLVEEERFLELFDIIHGHRHRDVFAFVEALVDEGYDLVEFYHGLVESLRLLLRVRLDGEGSVDAGEEYRAALEARARDFEAADLVRMLAMAADLESQGSLKRVSQPRVLVELLLLRLSYLDRTVRIEDLIEGLGGAPARRATDPQPTPSRRLPASRPKAGSKPRAATRATAPAHRGASPPPAADSTPGASGPRPAGPRRASSVASPVPEPSPSSVTADGDPAAAFERLLAGGRGILRSGLTTVLRGARVENAGGRGLRVALPHGMTREDLPPNSVPSLRKALADRLGYAPEIDFGEGRNERPSGPRAVSPEQMRQERLEELVEREPLLARAVEELDLELVD